jgi:transposase
MTRFKNRIKSKLYSFGIPYPEQFNNKSTHWSNNFLRWLKEDVHFSEKSGKQAFDNLIQEVEDHRKLLLTATRQIRQLGETEKYASDLKLLKTVPGIGLVMAMQLLTEIEHIERFENTDHFAAYVGLVPDCHDSGERTKDGKVTKRGQSMLKNGIVESAWIAIRKDPAMLLAYKNYAARMDKSKSIIRIARKLLNRIYYVLKNKHEYVTCVVQ